MEAVVDVVDLEMDVELEVEVAEEEVDWMNVLSTHGSRFPSARPQAPQNAR